MSGDEPRRVGGVVAALVFACVVLSVANPALLVFVPLALLLVALPPRRPAAVALGLVLAVLIFVRPAGYSAIWHAERGWALLLGAWFILVALVRPDAGFFPRALAALALSVATAALVLVLGPGGWAELDWQVVSRIHADLWQARSIIAGRFGAESVIARLFQVADTAAHLTAFLYPSMLGLASLAGLGLAWLAFRRFNRLEGQPLDRFREFRFRDELLWLAIIGLILVLAPFGQAAVRAGWNLLLFMGALYGLRGAAVFVALLRWPGPLGLAAGALFVVLLYPVVMAATILIGLSDTWLDLRVRRRER